MIRIAIGAKIVYNEGNPFERMRFSMSKKPRPRLEKYMIQPLVIRTFTRFIIALTIALLWKRFVASVQPLGTACFFMTVVFLVLAWMAYLRYDGVRLPQIDKKLFDRKPKPVIRYGDMIDHIDEEPHPDDNLDDDELEFVTFISNLITAVIFLVMSFF